MRDIINELFVKMSRLVTQYDKFKRFIPFKYRRFILYIAIFTVITLGIKYYFKPFIIIIIMLIIGRSFYDNLYYE